MDTSPSDPRRGGEGAHRQVGELALIATSGPRLGCSLRVYTFRTYPIVSIHQYACVTLSRPAEIMPRRAERNASRTGHSTQKNLQECTHFPKALRSTLAGALARPHRTLRRLEGKKVPSESTNLCRSLRILLQRLGGLLSEIAIGVP
jgi:hypothetical protein